MLVNWLYAAQHESSHDTVFRRRWMNEWLGRVTGFILIYPRDHDRWQHLCHHRHTQDPERDSELVFDNAGRFAGWLSLSGLSFWRGLVTNLIRHAVTGRKQSRFEYYLNAEMERRVVAEARWHLAGYTLIAALSIWTGSWAAVMLWLAPMLAMSWTHQIQNIIEHTGMPFTSDTWTNTRTVRTNPLMRWLAWQMVYHTAHHTYPGVPFHRLAELHQGHHRGARQGAGDLDLLRAIRKNPRRTVPAPRLMVPGTLVPRRRPERGGQEHAHRWRAAFSGGRCTVRLCPAHCHPPRPCLRRHRDGSRRLRRGETAEAHLPSRGMLMALPTVSPGTFRRRSKGAAASSPTSRAASLPTRARTFPRVRVVHVKAPATAAEAKARPTRVGNRRTIRKNGSAAPIPVEGDDVESLVNDGPVDHAIGAMVRILRRC